jgi:hypothetical protein
MDSTLIQENSRLKDELDTAKKYIQELEFFKGLYLKHVDYEIKMFTENMPDGPAKDDFIKMMLKQFYKMENKTH